MRILPILSLTAVSLLMLTGCAPDKGAAVANCATPLVTRLMIETDGEVSDADLSEFTDKVWAGCEEQLEEDPEAFLEQYAD